MKYGESTFEGLYLLFAVVSGCLILRRARNRTERLMGLEEQGITPAVTVEDPGFAIPEGAEYIATVRKA